VKEVSSDLVRAGHFALGLTVGVLSAVILLIAVDMLQLGSFWDTAFAGAIIGAVIAGGISVAGQLVVIARSEQATSIALRLQERTKLERLLTRIVRTISTLAQVKEHIESSNPTDIVTLARLPPITKPLAIGDIPERVPEELIGVALQLSDRSFFNALNALDSNLSNFSWLHRKYEACANTMIENLRGSEGIKFENGVYSGFGNLDIRHYYELQDIWKHYVDSTYCGLVFAKRVGDLVVRHLMVRHGVDLRFSDRISSSEWKELFESVDVGDFVDDLR
jgi:uncharacterized protein (DUF2062 family)